MPRDTEPRWRRPVLWFLALTAVAALVVGAGAGAVAWSDTRDEIDRTAAALRDERHELGRARTELAAASEELEADRATLRAEMRRLEARETERDAAELRLKASRSRLTDHRAGLTAAAADLEERQARLDALDRCLRGVLRGLNQASVGDGDGMDATLASIAGACAAAGVEP